MPKQTYDASSISWSKGAEAIRGNVALYLGATDTNAVVHLAKEILGNSIDEAASGYGSKISITYKDGAVTIGDQGRGIPVGKHPKHPEYDTLTLLATELHTGGKSKANSEGYSVGTIGCFIGNTKIRLYGSQSIRIDKLYEMYQNDPDLRMHAFTYQDGNMVVKPITAVYQTRKVSVIAKVWFKGQRDPVECTVDHPFLTIDGMVRADSLKKGSQVLGDKPGIGGVFGSREVKKVAIKELTKDVHVYGLTVTTTHCYLLDAGVYVGNTHGLGLAVVNALSSRMEIWSHRNKKWYYQAFRAGKPVKPKPVVVDSAPKLFGHDGESGTIVRFIPDLSCFDAKSTMSMSLLANWLTDLSWFVTNNEIKRDKIVSRTPVKFYINDGTKTVIKSPGFDKYYENMLQEKKLDQIGTSPFVLQSSRVDVTLGWAATDDDMLRGYTNGAYNANGGVHVKALTDLVGKVFSRYAKKSQKYKVQDLLAGAVVLINIRLKSPRFDSQSKVRLVSEEAKTIVNEDVEAALVKWARTYQKDVKELIARACSIASVTASMKNDRKLAAALKTKTRGKSIYPEGMLVSTTKNAQERELFLCEGASAAGSAAKGSDRRFQEVLPLRGKIPNVMKGEEKAFASKVIIDMLRAIGYTPQTGVDGLRVGKVVFLTDADDDGPLAGNTRVHTLDGTKPTIAEVYKRIASGDDVYVWAQDSTGKVTPASVAGATKKTVDTYLKVSLDDGTVLKMSNDHRQAVLRKGSVKYAKAENLKVGQSIPCVYLSDRRPDGDRMVSSPYPHTMRYYKGNAANVVRGRDQIWYTDIYGVPMTADRALHHIAAKYFYPDKWEHRKRYNKSGIPGDCYHIDHINRVSTDNSPDNLQFLHQAEHSAKDGTSSITEYNKSDKKRRLNAKLNASTKHKMSVRKGKVKAYASQLMEEFGRVSKKIWDSNITRSAIGIPVWKNLSGKEKTIIRKSKGNPDNRLNPAVEWSERVRSRNASWYGNTLMALTQHGLPKNLRGLKKLRSIRENSVERTPSSKVFNRWRREFSSNHKIVSIEVVERKKKVYCLSVPDTGNFFISDKSGNMLLTGNSHISSLLMSLFQTVLPEMYEQGRVFVANTPLFIYNGPSGKKTYAPTLEELASKVGKMDTSRVTRAKGLGEVDADVLHEVAFNPATRNFTQLTPEDVRHRLNKIMGGDVQYRKEMLGL